MRSQFLVLENDHASLLVRVLELDVYLSILGIRGQKLELFRVIGQKNVLEVRFLFSSFLIQCLINALFYSADCHFSHPPSRPTPFSAPKSTFKKSTAYSATFNGASAPSTTYPKPESIGAWPKEEKSHISDRLQRFSNGEGEGERIIPGEIVVVMDTEEGNVKSETMET